MPIYSSSGIHVSVRCDACGGPLVSLCARNEQKREVAVVGAVARFQKLGWLFVPDPCGGRLTGRGMMGTPGAIGAFTCPACVAKRST